MLCSLMERFPNARVVGTAVEDGALLANLDVVDRMDFPARDSCWIPTAGLIVLAGVMAGVEEELAG